VPDLPQSARADISTTINIYTNLSKADVALNLAKKSKKIKAAE